MEKTTSILIVEDEHIVAIDTKSRLVALGYEVVGIAATAEKALGLMEKHTPDLVLMDIELKGPTNGIKTTEMIRDRFSVPVIYATAYADKEHLSRIKASEPLGIIAKPFGDNELLNVIETAMDRFQLEQQLRERESLFRATLNSIGDAVISTDTDKRIINMNPEAEKLTGWTEEESLGKPLSTVLLLRDGDTGKQAPNPAEIILDTGKKITLKNNTILISKKGREYQIADSGTPLRDEHNNIHGTVIVFRDVTASYRLRQQLKESNDFLEGIFNAIPDVLGVQDNQHNIIRYNVAGYKFLDLSPEEVKGKKCYELIGRTTPCHPCATTKCYDSRKPEQVIKYVEELNIWLECNTYPILDDEGNISNVIEHFRKIEPPENANNKD